MTVSPQIVLLGKDNNRFCHYAEKILTSYFLEKDVVCLYGKTGDEFKEEWFQYRPEYVISFLSPWILSQDFLDTASVAAINFHPGSPDYPGTGGYSYALYEGAERYGVTVHHMLARVDSGRIILTDYFPVASHDTVETLQLKAMNHLLICFEKIIDFLSRGKALPSSDETWRRNPLTTKDLFSLYQIDPLHQNTAEIERRIRASLYPSMTNVFVELAGKRFYVQPEQRLPIVKT